MLFLRSYEQTFGFGSVFILCVLESRSMQFAVQRNRAFFKHSDVNVSFSKAIREIISYSRIDTTIYIKIYEMLFFKSILKQFGAKRIYT